MKMLPIQRFYSLDVIRGLAALSIVFWHWNHFFIGTPEGVPPNAALPFYPLFFAFYNQGEIAADFFFMLSGYASHRYFERPMQNLLREKLVSETV